MANKIVPDDLWKSWRGFYPRVNELAVRCR